MSNTTDDMISRAEHETTLRAARSESRGHGEQQGRTLATERIRAILTSPEAQNRMPVALVLALDSELAPEAARKALLASPAAAPARPALDARLNPAVPADRPSRH